MNNVAFVLLISICTSCSTTYFVVRHAEKEVQQSNMTADVPLSNTGVERAAALGKQLQGKKIRHLFSTNTIRTTSTAKPLSEATGIPVQLYNPGDTNFINRIKVLGGGNVLIVGHSNTVDNIVNGLMGKPVLKDLPDTQYGNMFIIKKKGNNYTFSTGHFGQ
jgi:broad specificity phosphatase PhoE